jgi:hypothetical protein
MLSESSCLEDLVPPNFGVVEFAPGEQAVFNCQQIKDV